MPRLQRREDQPSEIDVAAKRTVLRWFTYGLYAVTVATSADNPSDDEVGAFTANWLSQASFEPPLLMLSVEADSHSLPLIRAAGRFAVNVFAADQRDLAGHFGKKTRHVGNKLTGIPYHWSDSGLPILDNGLGYVVCEVDSEVPAGDSVVVIARVIEAVVLREGDGTPLTMAEAGFRHAG